MSPLLKDESSCSGVLTLNPVGHVQCRECPAKRLRQTTFSWVRWTSGFCLREETAWRWTSSGWLAADGQRVAEKTTGGTRLAGGDLSSTKALLTYFTRKKQATCTIRSPCGSDHLPRNITQAVSGCQRVKVPSKVGLFLLLFSFSCLHTIVSFFTMCQTRLLSARRRMWPHDEGDIVHVGSCGPAKETDADELWCNFVKSVKWTLNI